MRIKTTFEIAGAICAAAIAIWLGVSNVGLKQTITRLEAELRDLRMRPQPVLVPPQPTREEPRAAKEPTHNHPSFESTANPEADLLRSRLQGTVATVKKLEAQITEMQEQLRASSEERAKFTASEEQNRNRIEELSRTVDGLSGERAALGKKVTELEASNAKLRDTYADASKKQGQIGRLASDLEDISRRQQMYLTNMVRRYREVTDLFRAYPGVIENKGNSPEISRIQSVLATADEDLRQFSDLNMRLGRVQKQITTAVASR